MTNKYIAVRNGGIRIDKRTLEGKQLIKRIKEYRKNRDEDIPDHYQMLRIKDIKSLFTLENIIPN